MGQKYSIKKFGEGTERRDYSKTKYELPPSDLLSIQLNDFRKFLETGIDQAFKDIFPVHSRRKEKIIVEYVSSKIHLPKNNEKEIDEARFNGANFAAKLTSKLKMTNLITGEVEISDNVYIARIPLMTDVGSFIINGSERIIISQIVRSPNVYFENLKTTRAQLTSDNLVFKLCTMIPSRGAWIEFDYKDYKLLGINPLDIKLRIDKSKRIKSMILFFALGLSEEEILELFNHNELVKVSLSKLKKEEKNEQFARMELFRSSNFGDKASKKQSNEFLQNIFFDRKRYYLSETGRYKLNEKLFVGKRLKGKIISSDILDSKGNVLVKKGTLIKKTEFDILKQAYDNRDFKFSNIQITDVFDEYLKDIDSPSMFKQVQIVEVYDAFEKKDINEDTKTLKIVGNIKTDLEILTISDIISTFSYFMNLEEGMLSYDDIDSLSNRKILNVNELLKNQFRIGLSKIEKNMKERISVKDYSTVTIKSSVNYKSMESTLKEFFNSSQLSQFMDQVNPLSEISNKRRITSLGPGGISRETASIVIRGIHDTHFGRIDPIETPEGPNIGLILNFSIYSKLNKYGFILTPYFKVDNGKVDYSDPKYFSVSEEEDYVIASGVTTVNDSDEIIEKDILARLNNKFVNVSKKHVDYIDVSPKQIVSIASSHIPFLENNDANRALMGANMQRQAIPLIKPESPIVATGIEQFSGKFSPTALVCKEDGVIDYIDSLVIKVKNSEGLLKKYKLRKFERSNQGTSITHKLLVKKGDNVKNGQLLADGPSMDNGELSLGRNVLVAFTTWRGFNYEDAIIISERLVKDDTFTSIHIEKYRMDIRKTKLGNEKISGQIPNVSKHSIRNLDSEGIISIGSYVKYGDVLVGKTTPIAEDDLSPEEKLLSAIIGNKIKNMKDSSLRVPYGGEGIIVDVEILSKENGNKLEDGVLKSIVVYIAKKRKIKEGDKMSGRHGNKAVISKIVPMEDMPFLEDGTPVDVMLNPLGVPSRMNIGQVLELHLGIAARKLGIKVCTPPFNGVNSDDLKNIMLESNMSPDGKFDFYDGITGKKFDSKVSVGIMYILKLSHMIDDKLHARSVGPYSLITQQPLRGKSQNGGQRFGEMESWALEAYGASNILQEMMTLKSDDIRGRNDLYNSIVKGLRLPSPSIPEAFWVLFYELRGLGFSLTFFDKDLDLLEIDNSL